jgi:uncharacterized surface protein with fasciclin (FAS1) repeats
MFKILAVTFTMLLAFGLHPTSLKADAPSMTLGQILLADGDDFDSNQNDFDIVTQAVLAFPALTAAAVNPAAELTVFLPTDKAFRILVEDVYGVAIKDEAELFDAIVEELTLPVVGAVLQYHIVGAILDSNAVVSAGDGYEVHTLLENESFELDFKGRQIRLIDNEPGLRDPIVRAVDIHAVNGVAHVIDRVLIP